MRESVPTARYSPVCNVLRQWKTSLILTYRVYRLYDNYICMHVFYGNVILPLSVDYCNDNVPTCECDLENSLLVMQVNKF